jgi:hypothetical protein
MFQRIWTVRYQQNITRQLASYFVAKYCDIRSRKFGVTVCWAQSSLNVTCSDASNYKTGRLYTSIPRTVYHFRMRGHWTLPTLTSRFYWTLFTAGDCDIMGTAHYPELGVNRLIWDVQNIRHCSLQFWVYAWYWSYSWQCPVVAFERIVDISQLLNLVVHWARYS